MYTVSQDFLLRLCAYLHVYHPDELDDSEYVALVKDLEQLMAAAGVSAELPPVDEGDDQDDHEFYDAGNGECDICGLNADEHPEAAPVTARLATQTLAELFPQSRKKDQEEES